MKELARKLSWALGSERSYDTLSDDALARIVYLLTQKLRDRHERDRLLIDEASQELLRAEADKP